MKITLDISSIHGVTKAEIQRTIDAIERAANREPMQGPDMQLLTDAASIFRVIQQGVIA